MKIKLSIKKILMLDSSPDKKASIITILVFSLDLGSHYFWLAAVSFQPLSAGQLYY